MGWPSRPAIAVFIIFTATLAAAFVMHRDISLTLGNSEWDYIGQPYNRGVGTIDRADTLRDAVRPDGLYGQGYAIATWAVRRAASGVGLNLGAFRAAQLVTSIASLLFVIAVWRLGRTFDLSPDLDWAAPLAAALAWPFFNLAVQVTTDVVTAAIVTFAMIPLFRGPTVRGGAIAGLLLGAGFVVRGNSVSNLPLFVVVGAFLPVTRTGPRGRIGFVISVTAGFLVGAAPRLILDWVQTGHLYFHEQAQILRAVLFEGGLEAFRPDPVGVLEVIRRDPSLFARSSWASYSYYLGWLLAGLAFPLAVLFHERASRRRALAATALLIGIPIALATHPIHGSRYTVGLLSISAVVWIGAIDRCVKGRMRRLLPIGLSAVLLPLYALDVGLLADKYRFDLPEAEIVAALGASASASARTDPTVALPPVLLRPGVAFDQRIYLNAIRYRLRRLGAVLVDAPRPLDDGEVDRLGVRKPYFVLRVPISDTGPSVLWNRLRGRVRERHTPVADGVIAGPDARRVVFDDVSEVALYLVGERLDSRESNASMD